MKVTIIGLKPNQETVIEERHGYDFELTFVSSGDCKKRQVLPSADTIVLMTKFVPHQIQDVVRGHPGLVFVNGGISSLSNKLEELKL